MKRISRSPVSWAVLVLGLIFAVSYVSNKNESTSDHFRVWSLASQPGERVDYALLRPFVSNTGSYSIALEGGRQPIFAVEVPSVSLGAASDCPLQLLLLGDWDSSATQNLYHRLETIYRDDPAHALPPLKLTLLPSRAGSASGHFMESIIATHFVANQVETLPLFLREVSQGIIQPEKGQIRARLDQIEPELASRMEPFLQSQKQVIEKSYLIAQAQMRLHQKALQCTEPTQLVSMKQILTGNPDADQIKAFLLHAKVLQDAFLASPAGLVPLEPKQPR